jgi:hypothetical protein
MLRLPVWQGPRRHRVRGVVGMVERNREATHPGAGAPDAGFDRVVERATRIVTELDPVRASWLGIRGRHDHLLGDFSIAGTERAKGALAELLSDFEKLDPGRLDAEQQIDRELALGTLATLASVAAQRPPCCTMPQAALAEVLSGISVHLVRGCGTLEERGAALLGRLRSVPAFLAQAQLSLREPPPVFTEIAIVAAENTRRSLALTLADFNATLPASALLRSLERVGPPAVEALAGYGEFLRSDLMARSTGDFRLGGALFDRVLSDEHRIPIDGEELVVLGERVYHRTLSEIRALAGRIRPGGNWSRLLVDLKNDHPPADDLIEAYRGPVEAARRFLADRDLVTLPGGEDLIYVLTPLFARHRFPHAGYMPCGTSGDVLRGMLLVTPPDSADPPRRSDAMLRGHSVYAIPARVARETYPGRHLQFVQAARCGRPLRLLFPSPLFTQGWTLYGEEMMEQEGFLADDRVRFLQLTERLLCACRVVVDVGLHVGRMTVNEAVEFLVRKAKLERADALKEVYRCCEEPTVMMGCLAGKLLLEELREDERERRGPGFSLRAFHDAVLGQGALPPDLLRQALGTPRRRDERVMFESLSRLAPRPRRVVPPRAPGRRSYARAPKEPGRIRR